MCFPTSFGNVQVVYAVLRKKNNWDPTHCSSCTACFPHTQLSSTAAYLVSFRDTRCKRFVGMTDVSVSYHNWAGFVTNSSSVQNIHTPYNTMVVTIVQRNIYIYIYAYMDSLSNWSHTHRRTSCHRNRKRTGRRRTGRKPWRRPRGQPTTISFYSSRAACFVHRAAKRKNVNGGWCVLDRDCVGRRLRKTHKHKKKNIKRKKKSNKVLDVQELHDDRVRISLALNTQINTRENARS